MPRQRFLLDTHILIWAVLLDPRLPKEARKIIEDAHNEIHYSAVAMWEVALRHAKRPDMLAVSASDLMEYAAECGFYDTPLEERHTFLLDSLERPEGAPAHNDLFDRIMICQAKAEDMVLITHDARIAEYDEPCVLYV